MEVKVEDGRFTAGSLNASGSSIQARVGSPVNQLEHIDRQEAQITSPRADAMVNIVSMSTMPSGPASTHILGREARISPGLHYRRPLSQIAPAEPARSTTYTVQPFATPSRPTVNSPAPIEDMCITLKTAETGATCLGFLCDENKRRYIFYRSVDRTAKQQLTLRNALRPESPQHRFKVMSRKDRLKVALIMASSILQLHTTPWLNEQWNKNDIILYLDETQQRVIPDPYVCTKFQPGVNAAQTVPAITSRSRSSTKKALLNLGIALLELCFGKIIEDHPQRSQYFGPNNQPNAFTDISTAKEWHEDVLDEIGDDMSDCIRRCLDCAFGPKPNLEDKEFQEAFFHGVIVPLQDILRVWEQPSMTPQ